MEHEKLWIRWRRIRAQTELQKKSENLYGEQTRVGISCSKYFGNFFNPKWVKLDTLLKIAEVKQNLKSLVTERGHKENKKKNNRAAYRKALSLKPYS
jgi:hypothetical protein